MNLTGKDPLQQRLEIANWVVLAVFVLAGALIFSLKFTLGVLLGGLISIVNYHWLCRDVKKVFAHLTDRAKSRIMFKYYIRFGITAVALYFIVSSGIVEVVGLLIGLSTVIVNIVITAVMALSKKNCVEEVN
ncbi:MAG TPA: ATP synthase subunit I [Syntrophales bacterium]|nr:ATP synthase subunit I [Syntrophales bacterium]HOD98102.1 ATP synthase subunit I [Syntrophales bacterium]HOH72806.1 ATP synthase subunit I [Syntrophales bacterium]HPN09664.1 ATP synthase subunit I [Syntrophales bacterium]HPX81590.1 ATP synthase subunit I [Syntrophales bacterium]